MSAVSGVAEIPFPLYLDPLPLDEPEGDAAGREISYVPTSELQSSVGWFDGDRDADTEDDMHRVIGIASAITLAVAGSVVFFVLFAAAYLALR